MKKIKILLLILVVQSNLYGQQESLLSFYREHLNLVNPAFVGVEGTTNVKSTFREQWTGIENAPSTQALSFMSPLGKQFSFGVSVVHDQVFIEKQTFVAVDFSYQVILNEKVDLFMGLKLGGNNYEVNTAGLKTYNIEVDPSLASISRFNPNIGVGFYLKHDKYYVSLSTPRFLNTERARNEEGFATVATDRSHFYLSGGYNFMLNEKFDLLPSMMVRYVNGAPFNTDFTLTSVYNSSLHFGATYRTNQSFAGFTKMKINKNIFIGYAYEYIMSSDLIGRANGSNELFLQYTF
jgi:type IX secretion system PorP/SprF family membrane protein